MNKPEQYEEKLKAAQFYRRLATRRVITEEPELEEIIDDIFSDYHEAYANFQENKQPLAQKRFIEILNKLPYPVYENTIHLLKFIIKNTIGLADGVFCLYYLILCFP